MLLLMLASGFAGLAYQVVWTQQASLWLGHESAAVLAVVTAFFGGLALGAGLLGPRVERSAKPALWYAGCEAMIALWAGVLVLAMAPAGRALLVLTGPQPGAAWQWAVAFGGTALLLLPATVAMGATLPAMARVAAAWPGLGPGPGHLAGLYAVNTLGAVLGVVATAFWLVPTWGLSTTAGVCAGLNAACALCALVAWRCWPGRVAAPTAAPVLNAPVARPAAVGPVVARLALTGLLGIAYEVLVVRVLSQVTENTVYTFALLLAVYLAGTALGAAAYRRWQPRWVAAGEGVLRDRLLGALAGACLLGAAALWCSEAFKAWLQAGLGDGFGAALAAEALLAVAAFALPTAVMGALFSHLAAQASAAGLGFGRALAVNTLGAACAPPLFGVWLVPAFGPKAVLLGVALAYLALGSFQPRSAVRALWLSVWRWGPALAGAGLVVLTPPLAFVDVPDGGRVLRYEDGALAAVSVVETADGVALLRINNRQQEGSSATALVDGRQALLPLLLHPAPRRALFLGLGTGVTASTATLDPALQVQAVELLPEVVRASAHFNQGLPPEAQARLQVLVADARRHVRSDLRSHVQAGLQPADPGFDVVVADNFHPARSGSGALYTVEHFRAVQARLAEGGVFCQWLPLHQLDNQSLRHVVAAFLAVFPQGTALLASNSLATPVLGLLGRADGGGFQPAALQRRLEAANAGARSGHAGQPWLRPPAAYGLVDVQAVLGSFVAGPRALAAFAEGAALNTDDHPVVAYSAPRITYAPDSLPGERLMQLLGQWPLSAHEVLAESADAESVRRVAAYWRARHAFLAAGLQVKPSADVRAMLDQVRDPLLAVLRVSPDFHPAREPLQRMAQALARTDPAAAERLLAELAVLQRR